MDIQNPISINILNQKITPLKTMGIGQPEEKGTSLFKGLIPNPVWMVLGNQKLKSC